jgi:hypothetical protein
MSSTQKTFKPTRNLIRHRFAEDSSSSWSMTNEEINPSPNGAYLNQRRIKSAPADLTSSGSMTDKEMNAAPEGRFQIFSGLNLHRFKIPARR